MPEYPGGEMRVGPRKRKIRGFKGKNVFAVNPIPTTKPASFVLGEQ